MCGFKDSKFKFAAGIIAMMMLLYIVFSAFFISLEANHHCEDEENCPICEMLQICTNTLHQISDITTVSVIAFVPVLLALGVSFIVSINLIKETLITNKIRLNN